MKTYWVIYERDYEDTWDIIAVTDDEDLALSLQDRGYLVQDAKGIESVDDL